MAASLGELFVELGVFADTKELHAFEQKLQKVNKKMEESGKKSKNLTKDIKTFIKTIAGIATAITGAVYAINKLTDSLVQSNQEFLNLTRSSDISLGVFQKWNNIGRMLGVKNAAQQIEGLNQRLFELMLTGEGARGFQLAGINPIGQGAEGVMEQLRARVAGMSDTSATYLLKQLGLDPTMLHLLRLTKDEFEALGQTIKKYQLTPEQTQQIQAMNVQLQIAQIKLRYLKDKAIMAIMPYVLEFMKSVARVAEGLSKIPKVVYAIAGAIGILSAALWALNAHPLIAAITAIIGVLYLLVDDVMAYFQGGGSILGVLLKFFEDLGQKLKDIFNIQESPLIAQILKLLSFVSNPGGFMVNAASNLITPEARGNSNVNNNVDNRQVNQNININTNQPADNIKAELYHANYAFA